MLISAVLFRLPFSLDACSFMGIGNERHSSICLLEHVLRIGYRI